MSISQRRCTLVGLYCFQQKYVQWSMLERTSLFLEPRLVQHLFVLAYIEIYVFRVNPFQAHSLEQSYHPTQPFKREKIYNKNQKYKCKNSIKLIYLTFIHCTCKFDKHKQSFVSENNERTSPNKKQKQYNAHEKHKPSYPSENYNRTFHNK